MVAAAVIGGAVIGAAGAAYAGSEASSATRSATGAAITEQQQALNQQATLSQPYRDLGSSNIQTYQGLLTGNPAQVEQTLQSLPGYQFTLNQGVEAAKRASGAGGLNLTGNQIGAVETFGAGLADQTYAERLNQLLQPIQIGQAAAAGQAANIGSAAGNISSALINQGNTQAGIDANTIAGITRAGSNATNQYLTYQTLAGLNPRGGGPTYGGTGPYSDPSQAAGSGVNPWTGGSVPATYDPGLGPG